MTTLVEDLINLFRPSAHHSSPSPTVEHSSNPSALTPPKGYEEPTVRREVRPSWEGEPTQTALIQRRQAEEYQSGQAVKEWNAQMDSSESERMKARAKREGVIFVHEDHRLRPIRVSYKRTLWGDESLLRGRKVE